MILNPSTFQMNLQASFFESLAASGWQVGSITMRLIANPRQSLQQKLAVLPFAEYQRALAMCCMLRQKF